MNNHQIGERLEELRKNNKLTQKELAQKLGLTNKAISKWENNNCQPTIDALLELSNLYNISVDEILKTKNQEKKISRIVLTGGPCAGKTTALSWIQNKFTKDNYSIIFVGESATELISAGITPDTVGGLMNFEKLILQKQLENESFYENSANYQTNDKILIVYDRGTSDIRAYLTEAEYKSLLNHANKNEVELRDNYEAVFHLVTAANGAEEFYTLENNKARTETIEEAKALDKRLIQAWTGHPHLRVIDNETNFQDKMKKLISEIANFLGEPEAYEIERKFLIQYPNIKKLEKLGAVKVDIIQTYLNSEKGEEKRIRQRGSNNNYVYFQTTKKDISPIKRIETEKILTKEEYLEALLHANPAYSQIKKERYCFFHKNQYFEIDIFPTDNEKAILEVELLNENDQIKLPKYLEIIKEVTDNKEYKNKSFAKRMSKNFKL